MSKEGTLVLTRKENENICFTIPASTEETVISLSVGAITGRQVKLACHAPKQVKIVRRELISS